MSEDDILLVRFKANTDQYRRDVDRARSHGGRRFREMQRDAEAAGSGIEKAMGGAFKAMGAFGKGLAGGLVGGLAVGGLDQIVGRVADLAKGIAEISDNAKMAGLKARDFQELKFVAEQNRIPIDALTDAMKELSLRADEWIQTGSGSGAEAFQRMGYSAEELARKLKDPKELLLDIIERMESLDSAARIRVFDEVFGGQGGEKFVQLVDRGTESLRKTISEAHNLGMVMSDEAIARADELDRKFDKIGTTVSTWTKQAILGLVGAMDDLLDRASKIEEQSTRNVQSSLTSIYDKLDNAKERLADLQRKKIAFPEDVAIDLNIERQTGLIAELSGEAQRLRDILDRRNGYSENFIYAAGNDAKGATQPVNGLNNALSGTSASVRNAVAGIKSFSDAIRALKEEVPELAAELANLDAKAKIEAVYQKALAGAKGQREIALANEMRGKALSSVNIKSATDDPTAYLSSVLASGKAKSHIEGMADTFASKLAKMIASMPDNLKGSVTINSGYRSVERQQQLWLDALKKYGSPEAARKWVAPPGNSQHNKGNAADLGYGSDAARQWVHANAGNFGLSFPLSNENWHIEDASARSKDTAAEIERLTVAATRQADAYSQITSSAREYIAAQGTEQQALGMTAQQAQALRYEQEMLNQAQRAGIAITPQQRQEIAQLAQGMAVAETSTEDLRRKQEDVAETARFFGENMTDALTGILTGTMTAEEALQSMLQTLIKATLQAALMGEGPLASLFGTKPTGKGGIGFGGLFGSILGGLFGFAEGGHVSGPGTGTSDSIPARLSNGEFVVNAKATRKNRAVLEAINTGRVSSFAEGGFAGSAPSLEKPGIVAANNNSESATPSQTFNVSSNITIKGSAGTPEQNSDLAKKMAREYETSVRTVVSDELRKQSRNGNFLNQRAR